MGHIGADHLLAALGRLVGIPQLGLDDAGCCALSFDTTVVNFEADEEAHRLFLYADVGDAPERLSEALYRDLLAANLLWRGTGGATLSLDERRRRFVLAHAVPVERISEADFVETVERFADIAETWAKRVADIETHPDADVEPLPVGLIHPGMLA